MTRTGKPRPRMAFRAALLVAVLGLWCSFSLAAASGAGAYGPDAGTYSIGRANIDGSGVKRGFIAGLPSHPGDLAADGEHIYWNTPGAGPQVRPIDAVGRANVNGTGVEPNFITGFYAGGIAAGAGRIYWSFCENCGPGGPSNQGPYIGRANGDGSGVEPHFIRGALGALALDPTHIYWGGGLIGRANLDGSGIEEHFLTTRCVGSTSMAVDARHIYWTCGDSIGRANLDGTGVEQRFITGIGGPLRALAVEGRHIYWVDGYGTDAIGRANVDGTGIQRRFIAVGWRDFTGLAVDTRHVYWTSNPPIPWLLALQIYPRRFMLTGRLVDNRCVAPRGTHRHQPACTRQIRLRITYKVNIATSTLFTIERRVPGRIRTPGYCVAETPANRGNPPCTRPIYLPGRILRASKAGLNSFIFNGKIGGHSLTPGHYRLNAYSASQRTVSFQIAR